MTDVAPPSDTVPSPTKFSEHPHKGCRMTPFYFVQCDDCGDHPGDDCAFADPVDATDRALNRDYDFYDGVWHCPECQGLPK